MCCLLCVFSGTMYVCIFSQANRMGLTDRAQDWGDSMHHGGAVLAEQRGAGQPVKCGAQRGACQTRTWLVPHRRRLHRRNNRGCVRGTEGTGRGRGGGRDGGRGGVSCVGEWSRASPCPCGLCSLEVGVNGQPTKPAAPSADAKHACAGAASSRKRSLSHRVEAMSLWVTAAVGSRSAGRWTER